MKSITQFRILIALLFVGAVLLSSCDNSTQTQKLKRENQKKQEKIDKQTQQINRLEERLNKIENQQNSEPSYTDKESNYSNYGSQYYFVVLEVVEKHYLNNEQFYYTTQVNQINNYNDNIKYRLLDEVEQNTKIRQMEWHLMAMFEREIFTFSIAMKKRAKQERNIL